MFVDNFAEFKKINPDATETDFTEYIELIAELKDIPVYRKVDKSKFESFKIDMRNIEKKHPTVWGKRTETELLDMYLDRTAGSQ